MYRHCLKAPTSILTRSALFKPSITTRTMATISNRVSDKIKHDHAELKSYHSKIKSASTPTEKTKWQNQFVWELARHSVAEELIVYPAFEKHLPGGEGTSIAARDRQEHQAVKHLLKDFQMMKAEDPQFDAKIDELWSVLQQHILEEERDDLPVLEAAIDERESEGLAKKFDRTKLFVPTQSHPAAGSEGGIYESAMGLLGAPVDKLMDLFKKFPEEGEKKI
ncbi:hypothetical protein QBC44DRAFT_328829 [Cladorrhinum sp. PSN332]|nr:hypothetical protein QBC44DRAFT_328829 [Cladorrhinum sp. PSN332]